MDCFHHAQMIVSQQIGTQNVEGEIQMIRYAKMDGKFAT